MIRFTAIAVSFSLTGFAASLKNEEICADGKKHYRTIIRHIESGGIGYEDGYTTIETFLASDPSHWTLTPFLDVRAHVFNNGKWASNLGIGLRSLWKNRAYGLNTYYDYRDTGRFNSNQIGMGLETLGELFDFRINGYLPVGRKTSSPYDARFRTFSGHHMIISEKIVSAMRGADAEFGFHFGKSKLFDFYTAAGPYYFIAKETPPTWGGKARLFGTFKDILTLEISDSYDRTFHNRLQGQISFNFPFGPKSKIKQQDRTCQLANLLNDRILQPVGRQEIIIIDKPRRNRVAIDPATGLPYYFVFVDNTSSSDGTYKSPYHTLAQAQANSAPNDIIYVFPGNGTTEGMDAGILLKANQKFWGSGVNHLIDTTAGTLSIPPQSSIAPIITNTNSDTEGNAITLATNNVISGFTIVSALNDAVYGTDPQSLEVDSCTFQNMTTFPIETSFSGDAYISITNNQFLDNTNGISITLNGTSTIICSDNTFNGQTSVSNKPIEIAANSNTFTAQIENNLFDSNRTGSISFNLNNVRDADIIALNNIMTNNRSGEVGTSGSSIFILTTGTTDQCSVVLNNNTFYHNIADSLRLDTSGEITNLQVTATGNTHTMFELSMMEKSGSALVLATPITDTLALVATNNTVTGCNDNAMAVLAGSTTSTGSITINGNIITDTNNASNAIAVSQNFSNLDLKIQNNEINNCSGTGILSYSSVGIDGITLTISGNTISHCQNTGSNAASGIDIEQYSVLLGSVTNNIFSDNTGLSVNIGSTTVAPETCLSFTGNTYNDPSADTYKFVNPFDGIFNLTPCNVADANTGVIITDGAITSVQFCPGSTLCPP